MNGENFRVRSLENGKLEWSERYSGYTVKDVRKLGKNYAVFLSFHEIWNKNIGGNILCVTDEGQLIWKAKMPMEQDYFVVFEMDEGGLWATSVSGWKVKISPDNGEIIERIFTK